jgi:hypothetical protein
MLTELENVKADNPIAQQTITMGAMSIPISQADVLFDSFKPGFAFEIVGIEHFAADQVDTASYIVDIGTTAACTATTVVDDTRGDATLTANVLGTAAHEINLHCTTDGSGTLTDLRVRVTIRPVGLRS